MKTCDFTLALRLFAHFLRVGFSWHLLLNFISFIHCYMYKGPSCRLFVTSNIFNMAEAVTKGVDDLSLKSSESLLMKFVIDFKFSW